MLVRCCICEKRKYDETECELVPIGPGDRWASIRYGYKCPECALAHTRRSGNAKARKQTNGGITHA